MVEMFKLQARRDEEAAADRRHLLDVMAVERKTREESAEKARMELAANLARQQEVDRKEKEERRQERQAEVDHARSLSS